MTNLGISSLNGSITDTDVTLTLTDAALFANAVYIIQIGKELLQVTGKSGSVLTVTRGFEGTTPTNHQNGTTVKIVETKQTLLDYVATFRKTGSTNFLTATPGRIVLNINESNFGYTNVANGQWKTFGPTLAIKVPMISDFIGYNLHNGASAYDHFGGIVFEAPANSPTAYNHNLWAQELPSPPYKITAGYTTFCLSSFETGKLAVAGIALYNGTQARILGCGGCYDTQYAGMAKRLATLDSVPTAITSTNPSGGVILDPGLSRKGLHNLFWLQIEHRVTDIQYRWGFGPNLFVNLGFEMETDSIGATHAGFFINPYNIYTLAKLYHWEVES